MNVITGEKEKKMPLYIRLRQLRDISGKTQKEVAAEVQVSFKTWQRWETGENIPSAGYMQTIAQLFEMTVDELLAGVAVATKKELSR